MAQNKKALGRGISSMISKGAAGGALYSKKTLSKKTIESSKGKILEKKGEEKKSLKEDRNSPKALSEFRDISVQKIKAATHQTRENFDEVELENLANSIRSEGLLQPIVVRELEDGGFQLIAGERRLRAFIKLGLSEIPARVVKASNAASATMTLIENLQRENLNPMEEAFGLGCLMRDFNWKQEELSERIGKPRSTIANSLRLLSLEKQIQDFLKQGLISLGHAKVLLGLEKGDERILLAQKIIESGASVRTAEAMATQLKNKKTGKPISNTDPIIREISQEILNIEQKLVSYLHSKVNVKHGKNGGMISIYYCDNEDLSRVLEKIGLK